MDTSDMDVNVRLGVTISPYDLHRLKIWSMLHGRSPTTYAAQLISTQIEENFEVINKQLEDYAASQKKTVEEILASMQQEPNE